MAQYQFTLFILLLLFESVGLYSQKKLISQDSAISIAVSNGLPLGLSDYDCILLDDTIWVVKSLLCDDKNDGDYETRLVNALNGKIIKDRCYSIIATTYVDFGEKIEKTIINSNFSIDTLTLVGADIDRKLTQLNENESNPVFSENDEIIAFQYGFRKIGIISISGDGFKKICDECLYPKWLNNNWLVYFKDFKHLYKKNINTGEEIKLTKDPYGYHDYQISPDKKWIIYQSSEMWPRQDSLGNPTVRISINGQGQNLCLISLDGKTKKYFEKKWKHYYKPTWTQDSDTILFYISGQKYYATDFTDNDINYFEYNSLQKLSLWEFEKINDDSFPFIYRCQVFDISAKTLAPIRILINERGRYRDVNFSHNKKYLIYLKTDQKRGDYSLWIKQFKY